MLHLLPMGKNPPEGEDVMLQNGVFHRDPPFGCFFGGTSLGVVSGKLKGRPPRVPWVWDTPPFLTVAGCSFAQTLVYNREAYGEWVKTDWGCREVWWFPAAFWVNFPACGCQPHMRHGKTSDGLIRTWTP